MALGVLEASSGHVPGTSHVYDDASRPLPIEESRSRLKYDRSGPVPTILVPQPSDDPNDPLNWPLWKRDAILVILSITSVIASTLSPLLAANTLTLSLVFQRNFTQMALLTGYHLCGVGVAGLVFVASARVWGKRHLYLLGTILIIVSSAWGGASGTNYKSLLWARIIQGVGLAPFEALVNASVGDLFFVHVRPQMHMLNRRDEADAAQERGKRMALSNLALFGGAFFTPVLVGKITHTIGWSWTFYLIAIFSGVMLPLVILFCPETAYPRASALNTDITGERGMALHEISTPPKGVSDDRASPNSDPASFDQAPNKTENSVKTPYLRTLLPFNGRKTDHSFWKLLVRPFPLYLQPAIFWATLIQGTMIGWTVMIGVVLAAIFLGPPLWFDEVQTGYLYTGPFIGALLGFFTSGLLADWSAKWMTKRNKGIYEPEFRILLVLPQLVFGCAGLYGFGITGANVTRYGWFWPDFFFALVVMGMVLGTVASALYIVDAHRDIAVEAFTCMIVFKNMFSFGLTFAAYDWLKGGGVSRIFCILASVQLVICLLSVPMYILGKRNRAFFHKHNLLRLLHIW